MAAPYPVWLRWFAYTLLLTSAIPAGLTIYQLIRARHAPYYVLRREAFTRAKRWLLASLSLEAVAVLLLLAAAYIPNLMPVSLPTSTMTPTATATRAPTATPRPTRTPTTTPTRAPTATPPFIPTPTQAVPVPEMALSPLPSAVPAGEDARIAVITLATEEDAAGQPVDPGNEFAPGDHRVYLFFTFEAMQRGVPTTFAWYRDEELIEFCSDTWLWGQAEERDWGEKGRTSYYCKPPVGWEPGTYEIRVFIETRLQGIAQFAIREE